jgi:hypothetical protein
MSTATDILANREAVILAVTETNVHIQTESGKGVMTLTAADLAGVGGGGGGGDASAANQQLEIASLSSIESYSGQIQSNVASIAGNSATQTSHLQNISGYTSTLGAKTDAVATDDTGTFSITALFKRLLQKITSLVVTQSISLSTSPQVVAIGATSTQSSAVNAATNRVVLIANMDCWVAIGSNPTAAANTAGSFFLSEGIPSYPISVTGGTTKVAAIEATAAGFLSVIESA